MSLRVLHFFLKMERDFVIMSATHKQTKQKKKERKRSGFYNLEFQEEKEVISALFKNIH